MGSILVVDPTPMCRDLLAAVLRLKGFEVATASTGQEALLAIREQMPALVLLDLELPEIDGLAVMRVLRNNPTYRDREISCIVLTSLSDRLCVLQAGKLGAHDYILKSHFSVDDLLTRVSRVLAAHSRAEPRNTPGSSEAAEKTPEGEPAGPAVAVVAAKG